MQLNEHQSKLLFAQAGIPTAPGLLVDPRTISPGFQPPPSVPGPWMLKVQVLAGGRGKQGGVVPVSSPEELPDAARRLFSLEVDGRRPPPRSWCRG